MSLIPQNGDTIDLMRLLFRFTLDTTTEYLFGESVNSLDNPNVFPTNVPPNLSRSHLPQPFLQFRPIK